MKTKGKFLKDLGLALSLVAVMCATAIAGEQKYDESTPMEELKAASNSGDAEAMVIYGMRLLQAKGEDANVVEGLDWLKKATEAGEAQAWYILGVVYANQMGVKVDFDKAIDYWRKGAEAGDADCQTSLGMIYQAGDRIPSGIEADPAEAAKWYRMAAEQDHTEAIWHLAGILARGVGVEQNNEEAIIWLHRGAELGSGDCIWGLSRSYLSGQGVEVDSVKAYALMSACLEGIHFPEQKKAIAAKRDELSKALTAEQLAQAEPITEKWKAKIKN
jgi:TPR repeat protein